MRTSWLVAFVVAGCASSQPALSAPGLDALRSAGSTHIETRAGQRIAIHASTLDGTPVVEWWRATARGLEQGFDVPHPASEHPLRVRLEIRGELSPRLEGPDRALLVDRHGVVRMHVAELATIDARGERLPTSFVLHEGALEIVVDDRDAEYPLVIDPLYTATEHVLLPAIESPNVAYSVAGTRDLAVVGAPYAPATAALAQGGVVVFRRAGPSFVEGPTLRRPAGVGASLFGRIVATDGTRIVAASAGPADAAVVYVADGDAFREEAVLVPAASFELVTLRALAFDGDTIALGTEERDETGTTVAAVHVFRRSDAAWTEEARFAAVAATSFGSALDLDGDTLVIGAPGTTIGGRERAGRVFVYTRSVSAWSETAAISGTSANWYFGAGVAVESDVIAIGEPGFDRAIPGWGTAPDVGRVHVHRFASGAWPRELLLDRGGGDRDAVGGRLEIEGNILAIGGEGAVMIWEHDGSTWRQANAAFDQAGPIDDTYFGAAIDLAGTTLIVGDPNRRWADRAERGAAFVHDLAQGPQVRARVIEGEGSIVADVPYLYCGLTCEWAYPPGTTLTLTAQGQIGWELASWGGACAGATDACTIVVGTGDVDVEATFRRGVDVGEVCRVDLDCDSGHCVDQVCCDRDCGGSSTDCSACSVADGAVADGVCTVFGPEVTCRPGAECEPAEHCDGTSFECPPDTGFTPAGTICREANGACDAVEVCTGASAFCPTDRNAPSSTVCRPVAGDCDIEETCTGTSRTCPFDRFQSSAIVCRAAVSRCDRAERCGGTSPTCPIDRGEPDGAFCDDTSICNGIERCMAGACVSPGPLECEADGDPCTAHLCTEPAGCEVVAIPGCVPPEDGGVADAGAIELDSGTIDLDAGSDAGARDPDAGAGDAGPVLADAAPAIDGGAGADPTPSCGCRAITTSRSPRLVCVGALLIALAMARRRRRTMV
ncbi:Hypothetical protein I5071_78650 [Sandaracinus amylolyticus]|nr:Hypothetical protein I5071_78650 [Sandaracinus amylolyticus]